MKFLLILLVLVGLGLHPIHAQNEYTVVKVKGKIKLMPGEILLKAGSKIKDSQKVAFQTAGAAALVVHPRKGEFVLKQKQAGTGQSIGKALQSMVSNCLQLTKRTVATRSFVWIQGKDIKKNFGPEPIIISNDTSFVINSEKYPMSTEAYFYLNYQYRGESINKTLDYEAERLYISPKKIFTVDGNPIDEAETSQLRLYYYRESSKTAEFICCPNFIFFN